MKRGPYSPQEYREIERKVVGALTNGFTFDITYGIRYNGGKADHTHEGLKTIPNYVSRQRKPQLLPDRSRGSVRDAAKRVLEYMTTPAEKHFQANGLLVRVHDPAPTVDPVPKKDRRLAVVNVSREPRRALREFYSLYMKKNKLGLSDIEILRRVQDTVLLIIRERFADASVPLPDLVGFDVILRRSKRHAYPVVRELKEPLKRETLATLYNFLYVSEQIADGHRTGRRSSSGPARSWNNTSNRSSYPGASAPSHVPPSAPDTMVDAAGAQSQRKRKTRK